MVIGRSSIVSFAHARAIVARFAGSNFDSAGESNKASWPCICRRRRGFRVLSSRSCRGAGRAKACFEASTRQPGAGRAHKRGHSRKPDRPISRRSISERSGSRRTEPRRPDLCAWRHWRGRAEGLPHTGGPRGGDRLNSQMDCSLSKRSTAAADLECPKMLQRGRFLGFIGLSAIADKPPLGRFSCGIVATSMRIRPPIRFTITRPPRTQRSTVERLT